MLLKFLAIVTIFYSSLVVTGKSMADDINLDVPRFKEGDCLVHKAPMSDLSSAVKIKKLNKITFRGQTDHIYVIGDDTEEFSMATWQFDIGEAKRFNCKDFLNVKVQVEQLNNAVREHREHLEAERRVSSEKENESIQATQKERGGDLGNGELADRNEIDDASQKKIGEDPSSVSNANPQSEDTQWLHRDLNQWIQSIEKHYPATLRLEGVQGKVVLVAMLHKNGTLTDVKIARSSGNTVLDRAAIADVEQGPPIKLSRPLGHPKRPIKLSISYGLQTAR